MLIDMMQELIALNVAAESLGISTRQLHRLLAGGEVASVRIGRRRLIRRGTLHAFVTAREAPKRK
jgi:excisionase family DNA binding protein